MVRLILQALVVLLWLSFAARSTAQTKPTPQPLGLGVEIVNQSACKLSPDSAVLELRLRVTYTNAGTRKLILYKGHDLFYQTRIRNEPSDGRSLTRS